MKVFFVIIMLVLAGCAASSTRSIQERSVLGSFCHSSIDASLCLELKEDHRYAETFSGGGVILLGPNGEIPKASPEPRGSGRWELRSNEVVLLPVQGPRRILQLSEIRGAVDLAASDGGGVTPPAAAVCPHTAQGRSKCGRRRLGRLKTNVRLTPNPKNESRHD